MKTFTDLSTLDDYHHELAEVIRECLFNDDHDEPFMWSLGGDVHVIETQEEYDALIDQEQFFDIAEERIPGWFMIVVINNNSGGPSWFVPIDFTKE